MSLKKKLSIALLFLCAFLITIELCSHFGLSSIQEGYDNLIDQSIPKLGDISGMRARQAQSKADAYKLSNVLADSSAKEATRKDLEKNLKRYAEIESEYKSRGFFSKDEEKAFDLIHNNGQQVLEIGKKILELTNDQNITAADLNAVIRKGEPMFAEHQKSLLALDDFIVSTSEGWSKQSRVEATRLKVFNLILSISIFLIMAISTYFFSKHLNSTLSAIADHLRESSGKVEQTTYKVTDASHNLSSSANQQASALQQTVAAATEVASMIKNTADNSTHSLEKAHKGQDTTREGQASVAELINSIEEITKSNAQINTQVEKSNEEMKEILALIQTISDKTKVINDIVFQTKILSFNASVEAARAGELGKGFSVVAEEVSKLAAMSGKAAEEIHDLLEKSNSRVKDIVEHSRSNVAKLVRVGEEKVSIGKQRADGCQEALEAINADICDLLTMNTQITNATKEQSVGMDEISKALEQIELTTTLNADASRLCSQASDELTAEIKTTKELVLKLTEVIYGKSAV